jgi:hypothetical protein
MLAAIDAAFQAAVKAEVDSQLTEIRQHFANTVGELATKLAEAQLFQRTTHIDLVAATDALNQQEWFWEKIRSYIDAGIESSTQDFVAKDDLPDFDDFLTKEDFPDADDIVTKDELPEFPDPDDLVTKDELAELVNENIEGRSFTIRF